MSETKQSTPLQKFFAMNSKPTKDTFPELPDMVVWMRFILALTYGAWLGLGAMSTGGANVIFGLNFVTFVPIVYCSTYLGADSDSYDTKIFFSGVINSVALLLLIWTYFYTLEHAEDEAKFSAALANAVTGAVNAAVNGSDDGITMTVSEPVVEESEF
jgi:hypothetical protein